MSMAQFDDISIGELARNQRDMEVRLNKRLDDLAYVPRGEYEERVRNSEKEIAELKERLQWAGRAIVTAILMTPLSVFITTYMVTK